MSRYRGPHVRIIRRLGELPGYTQKNSKGRNFPPGQHGGTQQRKKLSMYGIRLQEKQRLRFNYGISESQLLQYVKKATRERGSTGEVLLKLLEMRLDNVIYRLGFVSSIAAAKQIINHGHVIVNQKKVTLPSYECQPNDNLQIKNVTVNSQTLTPPPHLVVDANLQTGYIKGVVNRQHVGLRLNELLIVEFYSRQV